MYAIRSYYEECQGGDLDMGLDSGVRLMMDWSHVNHIFEVGERSLDLAVV